MRVQEGNANERHCRRPQVALFACDPNNGNPIGFAPSSLLAPLDAFEMYVAPRQERVWLTYVSRH